MASSEFDKDFGYLMPFLDKVAAAASNLSNPAARSELTQLMADEKRRWARVRELLSGAASPVKSKSDEADTRLGSDEASEARTSPTFTVGSLRPGARR